MVFVENFKVIKSLNLREGEELMNEDRDREDFWLR